ncbi:DUF2071 domain-containing protein [soil metagenome]
MPDQPKIFLTAEWRKLAIANYSIDPKHLIKYLPHKTELDLWNDKCYVSLIGFMFLNTKVKGIRIPFHINFEEINLRFYVRHKSGNEWRRGVVFIKEIVSKPFLALVANLVYGENYKAVPTNHSWLEEKNLLTVEYTWKEKAWNSFLITADNRQEEIEKGSEEEFITQHFWGYTKINESKTSEYEVEHPEWKMYNVKNYRISVDFSSVYGDEFGFLTGQKPDSVFLAEGSQIIVRNGNKIK